MYPCLLATLMLLASTSASPSLGNVVGEVTDGAFSLFKSQKIKILQQLRYLQKLAGESDEDYEDATLSTPQLIKKYGYPVETHEILTEDGYYLTFFRIPYGKYSKTRVSNSRPIFLQHGLMGSADDWIVTGPDHGFGYILADSGYDVWIGNSRDNKWSRRHTTLSPEDSKFWDFSWHEMGIYDLPASIDYILNATGEKQLFYSGVSMGTTTFIVLGSERPEYNSKIRASGLLGTAVYFENRNDPFLNVLAKFTNQFDFVTARLGINQLVQNDTLYTVMGDTLCKDGDPTQTLCVAAAYLFGANIQHINKTLLPVFLGHFPSGTATKNYLHYGQVYNTGEFKPYDYGTAENQERYKQEKPPKYDVTKVTAPVIIHYAEHDPTTIADDVLKLADELPNVKLSMVPEEDFNHLDFVISERAKELVYEPLIRQFDEY